MKKNVRLFLQLKVKLATVVEGDQKAPFSIATTPRCREEVTLFHGLRHFNLNKYLIMLWVLSKEVSSTISKVFGMTRPEIESRSPGPLANTLHTWLIEPFANGPGDQGSIARSSHIKDSKNGALSLLALYSPL